MSVPRRITDLQYGSLRCQDKVILDRNCDLSVPNAKIGKATIQHLMFNTSEGGGGGATCTEMPTLTTNKISGNATAIAVEKFIPTDMAHFGRVHFRAQDQYIEDSATLDLSSDLWSLTYEERPTPTSDYMLLFQQPVFKAPQSFANPCLAGVTGLIIDVDINITLQTVGFFIGDGTIVTLQLVKNDTTVVSSVQTCMPADNQTIRSLILHDFVTVDISDTLGIRLVSPLFDGGFNKSFVLILSQYDGYPSYANFKIISVQRTSVSDISFDNTCFQGSYRIPSEGGPGLMIPLRLKGSSTGDPYTLPVTSALSIDWSTLAIVSMISGSVTSDGLSFYTCLDPDFSYGTNTCPLLSGPGVPTGTPGELRFTGAGAYAGDEIVFSITNNLDGTINPKFTLTVGNSEADFMPCNYVFKVVFEVDDIAGTTSNQGCIDFVANRKVPCPFPCSLSPGTAFPSIPDRAISQIALQSNGKIVCLASTQRLYRYNPDHTLDLTFGVAGIFNFLTPPSGTDITVINRMKIGPDDSIYMCGQGAIYDICCVKITPNGAYDVTWGVDGVWQITTVSQNLPAATDLGIHSDGTVILCSTAIIWKLLPSGFQDLTFGTGLYSNIVDLHQGYRLDVTTDGRIYHYGSANPGVAAVACTRYSLAGTLDLAYGNSGLALYEFEPQGATPCTDVFSTSNGGYVFDDGTVYVCGDIQLSPCDSSVYKSVIVKFNSDGSINYGFGVNGVFTFCPPNNSTSPVGHYYNLVPTSCGSLIAIASTPFNGVESSWIYEVDSDGELVENTEVQFSTEFISCITPTNDGSILYGGYVNPFQGVLGELLCDAA